ncbi:hypothetical protein Q7P37_007758 [Cladosporium fusiforme]
MAAAAAASPPPQQQQPSFGQARWVPSLPTNLIASLNPFAAAENSKDVASETSPANGVQKRDTLTVTGQESGPPSPTKSTGSIMFAEPESQGTSVSGSREGSIDGKRNSKKNNRPKTSFSICHPPPASSARQKLHRRPRSLLQLHKLTANARPLPAFEVIPSANFSVRLTRATAKVFRAKHSLCPSDLVVLRAEDYFTEEQEDQEEGRDVVALICKGRKEDGPATGKAKICMATGEEWEAYPLMNGGYEFFSTDEHGLGLTVRWVPKKCKKEGGARSEKKRFNFSTISANTRRHPVIATLSKTSLAIQDSYKMPDLSTMTPQATPKQQATILDDDSDDNTSKQEIRQTTERLRSIIAMSSIWVAFKEGWSPSFKYDDPPPTSTSRRNSIHSQISTPPASPIPAPIDKRASILSVGSSLFRKGSLRNRTGTFSSVDHLPDTDNTSPSRSPSHSQPKASGRARADSSSTVLVHRAASNRRNNRAQATWRPDLLAADTQNELRETSREGTPAVDSAKQQQRSPAPKSQSSRNPSRRASVLPDPDSASEDHFEPATKQSRGQSTSASSNGASSEISAQKKQAILVTEQQKKSKKWKKWLKGKF